MVKELWCLPPDTIAPVKDRMKYLTGYEQRLDYGDTRMLPTADVVHFMLSDPANEWWGISPLLAGAKAVDTDRAAVDWNKIAADNRGVPDGVFNFKTTLTEDQWAANRQVIKDSYLGRENARLPMIFSVPELDFQSLANTMVEMDFLAGRKFTAVEICMLFGVPPAVAGLFQAGAAQAEVANAREVFWLDTIIPRLVRIREVLNRLLVPEFGADASLDFDISNVDALNGPFSRKVLTAGQLFNMGYPANVVNNRLGMGMPPIPGGDQGYMPANYIPTIPGADGEGGGGTA
jgi:HK97 family phage portal protein